MKKPSFETVKVTNILLGEKKLSVKRKDRQIIVLFLDALD
jgi:hypothetical protein